MGDERQCYFIVLTEGEKKHIKETQPFVLSCLSLYSLGLLLKYFRAG